MRDEASIPRSQVVQARTSERSGIVLAVISFTIGGFLPLFTKLLADIPPMQIMAHRIIWCFLLLALLSIGAGRWPSIYAALRSRSVLLPLIASTLLISTHWLIFIWAVLSNQVLAASLGYFINPLLSVTLGMLVLGERLQPVQLGAVALAGIGVCALLLDGSSGCFIALALAFSFALYGLVRKMLSVDALAGSSIEVGLMLPAAAGWLLWIGPQSVFGHDWELDALLVSSGAMTGIPLLLFAIAAKRMRYSTLGILQYIVPSLHFIQAIALFDEPLGPSDMFAFVPIWAGLALYAWGSPNRKAAQGRAAKRL